MITENLKNIYYVVPQPSTRPPDGPEMIEKGKSRPRLKNMYDSTKYLVWNIIRRYQLCVIFCDYNPYPAQS